jgi:hypothetical protein
VWRKLHILNFSSVSWLQSDRNGLTALYVANISDLLPHCIADKCFFYVTCMSMSRLRRVPRATRMQQCGNEVSSHIRWNTEITATHSVEKVQWRCYDGQNARREDSYDSAVFIFCYSSRSELAWCCLGQPQNAAFWLAISLVLELIFSIRTKYLPNRNHAHRSWE